MNYIYLAMQHFSNPSLTTHSVLIPTSSRELLCHFLESADVSLCTPKCVQCLISLKKLEDNLGILSSKEDQQNSLQISWI